MRSSDVACAFFVGPAVGLLVVGLLVTEDALLRHRLGNHCLILCQFARCWLIGYGPQFPKILSFSTAFTIMTSPSVGWLVVGGLQIIVRDYPRCFSATAYQSLWDSVLAR